MACGGRWEAAMAEMSLPATNTKGHVSSKAVAREATAALSLIGKRQNTMRNRVSRVSAVGTVTVLGLLLTIWGCSQRGPAKPDHIPDLTPCVIQVTYNGQPVEGASVLLAPTSGQHSAAGLTDATGKAVMRTDGLYDGVVAGEFMASVTKKEKLELDLGETPEDPAEYAAYEARLRAQPKPKHLLPEKYSSFTKSGLTLRVAEGTASEETFELND